MATLDDLIPHDMPMAGVEVRSTHSGEVYTVREYDCGRGSAPWGISGAYGAGWVAGDEDKWELVNPMPTSGAALQQLMDAPNWYTPPPQARTCVCDIHLLMRQGCGCGQIQRERA